MSRFFGPCSSAKKRKIDEGASSDKGELFWSFSSETKDSESPRFKRETRMGIVSQMEDSLTARLG